MHLKLHRLILKLKKEFPYDLAILFLSIYPQKLKTLIWRDTCTSSFIAALVTIANIWKQLKCPTTDDWIKEMWYTHTRTYTHAHMHTQWNTTHKNKNEIMSFEESWMNLEIVMLSEVRQRGTTYMWNLKNNKNQFIYKTDSQTLKKKNL